MDDYIIVLICFLIILFVYLYINYNSEHFNIPLKSSSAWDWNTGPGYGAGYGTGYAMWGIWPKKISGIPWKNWMWGRRPSVFETPFTKAPQIEYNYNQNPHYKVSLFSNRNTLELSINGKLNNDLHLDRNRLYYFDVNTPGTTFNIVNNSNQNLINPISQGRFTVIFTDDDPDMLYYNVSNDFNTGGKIFLHNLR